MTVARNPVIRGFAPDPSLVRVGEWYYVATSSFEWFPTIPLYRSKDLANWEYAGHVRGAVPGGSLAGVPDSGGVWAPSLSWDGERFWVVYAIVRSVGTRHFDLDTYVSTASRVDGPWTAPRRVASHGFDPALFHHEGRLWLLNMQSDHRPGGKRFAGIVLTELDRSTLLPLGETHLLLQHDRLIEGPKLLVRDGWYYLVLAEGGTGFEHGVRVARSRELTGPYELDDLPLLTTRDDPKVPLQKAGHAELVETPSGEWYLSHLTARPLHTDHGMRCPLGRETAVQAVVWDAEGWPRLRQGGWHPLVEVEVPVPAGAGGTVTGPTPVAAEDTVTGGVPTPAKAEGAVTGPTPVGAGDAVTEAALVPAETEGTVTGGVPTPTGAGGTVTGGVPTPTGAGDAVTEAALAPAETEDTVTGGVPTPAGAGDTVTGAAPTPAAETEDAVTGAMPTPAIAEDTVTGAVPTPAIAEGSLAWPWSSLRGEVEESWADAAVRPGWIRLRGRQGPESLWDRSLLAQRITEHRAEVEVTVEASPRSFTEAAGLVLWYNTASYLALDLTWAEPEGQPQRGQQWRGEGRTVLSLLERDEEGARQVALVEVEPGRPITLGATVDGPEARFWYGLDGSRTPIGPSLDFTRLSDDYGSRLRFTGAFAGIHAQDLVGASFTADFAGFRLLCTER